MRARRRAEKVAAAQAWYAAGAAGQHDPTELEPWGISAEQHVAWCKAVLEMPTAEDIAAHLQPLDVSDLATLDWPED